MLVSTCLYQAEENAEEDQTEKEEGEEGEEEQEEDDTPKPDFKPPPVVPKEDKAGPNKKTYFVCNDRKFHLKFLSGHLLVFHVKTGIS